MAKDIVPTGNQDVQSFSADQIQLIKTQVCKDISNDELNFFLTLCKKTGLDPFTRQICAFKSRGKLSVTATIDGLRLIAERSGKYTGQKGPFWCGADGNWVDVWLKKEPPKAAKVGVLKSDFDEALWGVANYDSYYQTNKDGNPNYAWHKMPAVMIAKCAEALALRKAFPRDLSGIYSDEEMGQMNNEPEPKPKPQPPNVRDSKNVSPPPPPPQRGDFKTPDGFDDVTNQQSREGEPAIEDLQILYNMAEKMKWNRDDVLKFLDREFSKVDSRQLTHRQLQTTINFIEANPK